MGEGTTQTVKEIEAARARIAMNLEHLEERIPQPAEIAKRMSNVAVGGGIGGALLWLMTRTVRKSRARKRREREMAKMRPVVQIMPARWQEAVGDAIEKGALRDAKMWAVGMGGAMMLMRLVELRRLRQLNRALLRPVVRA